MTVRDIQRSRDNPNSCKDHHGRLRVAAATGTGEKGLMRALALFDAGADVVVVDTAHGHSQGVLDTVRHVRSLSNTVQIIGGNVATGDGARALIDAGVDAVKVGIGPGSICTTRMIAGVGVPQLTAILDATAAARDAGVPVIADGGIKNTGDIVKCLAVGADLVMLGSMLSGTRETPGKVIIDKETGKKVKRYNGMASKSAQKAWKGSYSSIEGVTSYVQYKGTVSKVIAEITSNIRSGMSYSGSRDLEQLRSNAMFIRQTINSHTEGLPHIYNRK
mgnify:CR=1 FL=1